MPTPVIIEAAINGSTKKDTNPNVPISPDEIAADALACFEAGASVVHNHIHEFGPDDVSAERYLEGWRPVWEKRPDALTYPTINPGPDGVMSYEHQIPLAAAGLRIGITDPGSLNLGGRDADGAPAGSFVYRNSFDSIGRAFAICREQQLGPSMAIYEPGWLRTVLAFWSAGKLPQGGMVKLYFSSDRGLTGAPFGLAPTRLALEAYLALLGDCPLPWAVSIAGGDVVASEVARLALERGGHLHLGLEFYGGDRQPTNVELVEEAVALCAEHGRPVASCDEAAEILDLPRR